MATILPDISEKFGVALNEATLLDVQLDSENAIVKCILRVVTVDKNGKVPDDNTAVFTFSPVGRLITSLRHGHWQDENARVQAFAPHELSAIIQSFNGQSIYGWEFFNLGSKAIEDWVNKLSLDYRSNNGDGISNTIDLFQEEGVSRHLDLRIWFDNLIIHDPIGNHIDLETFFENGRRAWDSIFDGKDQTSGFGIVSGN